jgi:branched-chain amino acid transport system permease protein
VRLFVQFLLDGISTGAVYALIALGFVIIFKASEVVTFAHGGVLSIGGYLIWWSRSHWFNSKGQASFWLSLTVGILGAALLGLLVERLLVRRMQGRNAGIIGVCIMTLGLDVVLETYTNYGVGKSGKESLDFRNPWGIGARRFGSSVFGGKGVFLGDARIAAIVIGGLIIGGLFLWLKYTDWGISMRAAATDREAASLMGIKLGRVSAVAWILAGALATVAVLFLAAAPAPGFDGATGRLAFKAFPAAILGGLDSPSGALAGGLIIGVSESMFKGYESHLHFLGRGFSSVVPYVVMLAVLFFRPTGLFGTREARRA